MDNDYKTLPEQFGQEEPVPDWVRQMQENPPEYLYNERPQPPEWTKNIVVAPTPWDIPENGAQPMPVQQMPDGQIAQFQQGAVFQPSEKIEQREPEPVYEEPKKNLPMWLQLSVVAVAFLVAVLMFNYVRGVLDKEPTTESINISYDITTVSPSATETTVMPAVPTDSVPSTAEPDTESTSKDNVTVSESEKVTEEKNTTKEDTEPDENEQTTVLPSVKDETDGNEAMVKKEVIAYFNESINRVKPEAVKVVKNFEKRTHNEEHLELPSAIKSVGAQMLNNNFTDDMEPVEYLTPEEITARFPVPGESWSSQLTEEEVAQAVCTDTGTEYEITIVLHSTVDPEPGKGVSKAVDCLNVPVVRDTAPEMITDFSAEYYDCVIKCRADKETGRILWANYTTPVIVALGLDAGFIQFDARIGLTFEKDYTIVY